MSSQPRELAQGLSGTKPPQSLAQATAKLCFRNANCRCDIFLNVLGFYNNVIYLFQLRHRNQNPESKLQRGMAGIL